MYKYTTVQQQYSFHQQRSGVFQGGLFSISWLEKAQAVLGQSQGRLLK